MWYSCIRGPINKKLVCIYIEKFLKLFFFKKLEMVLYEKFIQLGFNTMF